MERNIHKIGKELFITSNEEIKEGDWCINNINEVFIASNSKSYKHQFKKIILTTDQDLIKDGVQSIDDEFLEWFVKNPSCEFVNIVPFDGYNAIKGSYFGYEIIIPIEEWKCCGAFYGCDKCEHKKEEPKQETLEEAAEKLTNDFPALEVRFNMTNEEICSWFLEALQKGAKWNQERSYSNEEFKEIVYNMVGMLAQANNMTFNGAILDELFNKFKKLL